MNHNYSMEVGTRNACGQCNFENYIARDLLWPSVSPLAWKLVIAQGFNLCSSQA